MPNPEKRRFRLETRPSFDAAGGPARRETTGQTATRRPEIRTGFEALNWPIAAPAGPKFRLDLQAEIFEVDTWFLEIGEW